MHTPGPAMQAVALPCSWLCWVFLPAHRRTQPRRLQTNGGSAKSAIFSVWNGVAGVPGPSGDTDCGPFGGEGLGYHCFLHFQWQQGVAYKFTFTRIK